METKTVKLPTKRELEELIKHYTNELCNARQYDIKVRIRRLEVTIALLNKELRNHVKED